VERLIRELALPLEKIEVFDIYRGSGVEPGAVSISFSLTFRENTRTLTTEEVTAFVETILRRLETECGARLRK